MGVGLGDALGVTVGVGDVDGVAVGVALGVAVAVGATVGVAVGDGVGLGVGVAVGATVGVAVGATVGVAVGVGVNEGVAVGVGVAVDDGVTASFFLAVATIFLFFCIFKDHLTVLPEKLTRRYCPCDALSPGKKDVNKPPIAVPPVRVLIVISLPETVVVLGLL